MNSPRNQNIQAIACIQRSAIERWKAKNAFGLEYWCRFLLCGYSSQQCFARNDFSIPKSLAPIHGFTAGRKGLIAAEILR